MGKRLIFFTVHLWFLSVSDDRRLKNTNPAAQANFFRRTVQECRISFNYPHSLYFLEPILLRLHSCRDQATKSRVFSPLVGDTLEFLNLCTIPLNVVDKDTGPHADPQAGEHHPLLARQLQEEAQVLTTRYLVSWGRPWILYIGKVRCLLCKVPGQHLLYHHHLTLFHAGG